MPTRLRFVHTHPASTRSAQGRPIVLIGALTALATVAPTIPAPARRNGKRAHREGSAMLSAPPHVQDMGRLLGASGALEVYYFRGAADLITGQDAHMLSLDPGCYLLARFPKDHQPMDGAVAKFTKQAEDDWPEE